jgi:hypothetical protein
VDTDAVLVSPPDFDVEDLLPGSVALDALDGRRSGVGAKSVTGAKLTGRKPSRPFLP